MNVRSCKVRQYDPHLGARAFDLCRKTGLTTIGLLILFGGIGCVLRYSFLVDGVTTSKIWPTAFIAAIGLAITLIARLVK
jgi:hypothetical protein